MKKFPIFSKYLFYTMSISIFLHCVEEKTFCKDLDLPPNPTE